MNDRASSIRVVLPYHLTTLAGLTTSEVRVTPVGVVTLASVLAALEADFPMLAGTLRDRVSGQRRPMIRFFACREDWSNAAPDAPLPDEVACGHEPLLVVGAIAGG